MWASRRTRSEMGAGGIVIAAILYPILGLVVFALMLSLQGWSTAQANVDDTADQVAKAAVSQTVTTPSGELGIDCEKAEQAAFVAFSNSRLVSSGGDRFASFDSSVKVVDGSSAVIAEGDAAVTVQCIEPFEVTLPAFNYCPDTGGWEMLADGETCRRELPDRYEYFCTTDGATLVGNQCITLATIWECEDGRIVDQNAECGQELATAICPTTPILNSEYSVWGGWTLSEDKTFCVGTETAYLDPVIDFDCAVYGVSAPSTAVQSGENCFREPREYYCQIGALTGSVCRYVGDTRSLSYACPSGFTQSGSSCVRTDVWYTCPSGGTLSGTACSYQEATYPNAYDVWVCSSGTNGRNLGRESSGCFAQMAVWGTRQVISGYRNGACTRYNKSGVCTRWEQVPIYKTESYIIRYDWVRIGNATLTRRIGEPVYVTRTYAATRNQNTTTQPGTGFCSSGYVQSGSTCLLYANTSRSVRSTGSPQLLGPVRRILVDLGPATSVSRGPVDSVDRTYTPIRPTAAETSIFNPAPERKTNSEPLFEDRQFVTSAVRETFYRGVVVELQDSYRSPVGGALEVDLTRSAQAGIEQERLSVNEMP